MQDVRRKAKIAKYLAREGAEVRAVTVRNTAGVHTYDADIVDETGRVYVSIRGYRIADGRQP